MKILVTGGSGYLGSEVAKVLRMRGIDCFALGRRSVTGIVRCDLTDPEETRQTVRAIAPDKVVHAAAFVPKQMNEYHDSYCTRSNLVMLNNLLTGTSAPVLYVSSMTVYSHNGPVIRREEDAFNPDTAYGRSKLECEDLLSMDGRDAIAARIPGLFGGKREDGLIYSVLKDMEAGKQPILPNEPLMWAAMHVDDAAACLCDMVCSRWSGFLPVNIGYPEMYSVDRFVAIAESELGMSVPRTVRQPDFAFDLSRARSLGVVPARGFREALGAMMEK